MNNCKFYIYKMIHVPSGRVYIGKHKLPKNRTPENDGYKGSGKIWKRIYNKYKDECVKVVIDFADNNEDICNLEKMYIKHYKNVYGEFCVNVTDGGEGVTGFKHSEDAKHKMSEAKKGKQAHNKGKKTGKHSWNYGISPSKESIEKNRIAHIGKKASDETRKKMSESHKARKMSSTIKQVCVNQNRKEHI